MAKRTLVPAKLTARLDGADVPIEAVIILRPFYERACGDHRVRAFFGFRYSCDLTQHVAVHNDDISSICAAFFEGWVSAYDDKFVAFDEVRTQQTYSTLRDLEKIIPTLRKLQAAAQAAGQVVRLRDDGTSYVDSASFGEMLYAVATLVGCKHVVVEDARGHSKIHDISLLSQAANLLAQQAEQKQKDGVRG